MRSADSTRDLDLRSQGARSHEKYPTAAPSSWSSGLARHCSPHTRRETWLPSLRLPPVTSPRVRRDTRERAAHRLARSTDVARIYPPRGRTPAHPLRSHLGCLLSQARRSSRPSARSATSPRLAAAISRYVASRREQKQTARRSPTAPRARPTPIPRLEKPLRLIDLRPARGGGEPTAVWARP